MDIDTIVDGIDEKLSEPSGVDYIMYFQSTTTIGRICSLIYGILSTIILITVPLIASLELVYICFPVVRDRVDDWIVKVQPKGITSKAIGIALGDAQEAVRQANTTKTGKSALYLYLIIKIKSLMFLMFVLVLVLQGIGPIVSLVWHFIENIVNVLFG